MPVRVANWVVSAKEQDAALGLTSSVSANPLPEERVDPVLLLEPLGARPTVGSALLQYIRILGERHSRYHASVSSNCHSVPGGSTLRRSARAHMGH